MSAAKKAAKEKPEAKKAEGETPAKKGGDLAAKFGAWWNGVDYVPAAEGEAGADDKSAKKAEKPAAEKPAETPAPEKPEAKVEAAPEPKAEEPAPAPVKAKELTEAFEAGVAQSKAESISARVKALETLWGEGRLSPGSSDIDTYLLDAALQLADGKGPIGFIGADPATLNAFASRSDRPAHAAEWRGGAVDRVKALVPGAAVQHIELDRPRAFPEGMLEAVVSCDAFAFADHKNGLIARVHRALNENGRWVILDTIRTTSRAPAEAFASAWAEPQLGTTDDIEEILNLSGFLSVQKISLTELVLDAARAGYQRLSGALEAAAGNGMKGREGALFLQELAWEAQSWRARVRALEGGALEVNLWIADKQAPLELTQPEIQVELPEDVLNAAIQPDDAGAADQLFDTAEAAPGQ